MSTASKPASNSSGAAPAAENRMSFSRWFREIGWRHVVGVVALVFAAFPVLYVISASLNPLGTVASTGLIPTKVSLVNYQNLLSGVRGPFLRWYFNTIVICAVVATAQVFLSLLGAYAFSRFRFTGRRGGLLALLLITNPPRPAHRPHRQRRHEIARRKRLHRRARQPLPPFPRLRPVYSTY